VLIGELARLALNSSDREFYLEAAQEFRNALRLRGWPTTVLHTWFKEQLEKRWRHKDLEVEKSATDYLVMKTKYNPVWDGVKFGQIRDVIVNAWKEGVTVTEGVAESSLPSKPGRASESVNPEETSLPAIQRLIQARMLVAYSRTTSFGDLVNTWNKNLLDMEDSEASELSEEEGIIKSMETSTLAVGVPGPSAGTSTLEVKPDEFYGSR
jgi:hypothetical protein